jgi:hypothetical protein
MPLLDGSYLDTVLRMTRKKDLLLDEALCLPKEDRAEIAVKLIAWFRNKALRVKPVH